MNKGKLLACAVFLILGFASAAFAQEGYRKESGGSGQQGSSGSTDTNNSDNGH
jgi:hypothetical protein